MAQRSSTRLCSRETCRDYSRLVKWVGKQQSVCPEGDLGSKLRTLLGSALGTCDRRDKESQLKRPFQRPSQLSSTGLGSTAKTERWAGVCSERPPHGDSIRSLMVGLGLPQAGGCCTSSCIGRICATPCGSRTSQCPATRAATLTGSHLTPAALGHSQGGRGGGAAVCVFLRAGTSSQCQNAQQAPRHNQACGTHSP